MLFRSIEELSKLKTGDHTLKSLVFSQFTTMLYVLDLPWLQEQQLTHILSVISLLDVFNSAASSSFGCKGT